MRTQFDKTMSIIEGGKKSYRLTLDDDEVEKLKKWLTEGYKDEMVH